MQTKIKSNATTLSFVLGGDTNNEQVSESKENLLSIFIGETGEEQSENLQCIKDAIAHVLILCNDDSIMLSEMELVCLQHIYFAADEQLSKEKVA